MKILHISDLHICTAEVSRALTDFKLLLAAELPNLDFDIHLADQEVLRSLRQHILIIDPDILVLSGDITTLGDDGSFEAAFDWLEPLLQREGGATRPCLVVPGNHDALLDHLSALASGSLFRLGALKWHALKWAFRRLFHCLEPLKPFLNTNWTQSHHLEAFGRFVGRSGALHMEPYSHMINGGSGSRVAFFPFSTVSCDPLWMNAGFARQEVWEKLNRTLNDPNYRVPGIMKIALAHHNPLSSPGRVEGQVVHAYNSMPGGTEFLGTLQRKGIDILLHGHQHASALYRYDFDLGSAGHAYALGVPSATIPEEAGTALLEIMDVNNVEVSRFRFNPRDGFAPDSPAISLALERNRPSDKMTTAVRYEIKGYSYRDGETDDLWTQLQAPGSNLVYMSGRHLKSIREDAFEPLRELLGNKSGTQVRILVSDPNLLRSVAVSTDSGNGHRSDVWGTKEELESLAGSAEMTLERLGEFLGTLDQEKQSRVDVRVSHTLLPFAAFVRDADANWGKMTLKILPVGALGDLESPVLRLNRRVERALYDYYLRHLKYLFLKGRNVAGDWKAGEVDLERGLDREVVGAIRSGQTGRVDGGKRR